MHVVWEPWGGARWTTMTTSRVEATSIVHIAPTGSTARRETRAERSRARMEQDSSIIATRTATPSSTHLMTCKSIVHTCSLWHVQPVNDKFFVSPTIFLIIARLPSCMLHAACTIQNDIALCTCWIHAWEASGKVCSVLWPVNNEQWWSCSPNLMQI